MTFFPSGPRPLVRRPSKLPPNERLARPPQTPPKDYNSLPHGSPTRTSLAPIRPSSHSPSPQLRADAPLPPIPDEHPVSLLASGRRASIPTSDASKNGSISASIPEPVVPPSLRPGGPSRRHQHTASLPSNAHSPLAEPRPHSTLSAHDQGYSPGHNQAPLPGTYTPPAQSTYGVPESSYSYPPAFPTVTPTVTTSYESYDPPPLDRPIHYDSTPKPAPSPIEPGPNASISIAFPEPHISQLPTFPHNTSVSFPSHTASYHSYSTPPPNLGRHSVQPQPQLQEVDPREQEHLASRYNQPLPLPPGAQPHPQQKSHSQTQPQMHTHRTSTHSSELPAVPHVRSPSPITSPHAISTPPPYSQTSPHQGYHSLSSGHSPGISPSHSYSHGQGHSEHLHSGHHSHSPSRSPSPPRLSKTPVPDSYLERERNALSRARQEEEDEELARRLAAELEISEDAQDHHPSKGKERYDDSKPSYSSGASPRTSTYTSSKHTSHASEKKPVEKELSQEEKDAEFARRLAWELNEDLVKAEKEKERRGSGGAGGMPGGWHA